MKNEDHSFNVLAVIIIAGVIAAFLPSARAKEKSVTRDGTYQAGNGNSGTFSATTTRTKGEVSRNEKWTNQAGQTGTHTSDRTFNPAAGTGSVAASTTLTNGKTATRDGTITRNADGTLSGDGSVTGFNGQTATYATSTTKTSEGRVTTGTIIGENGNVATLSSTATHADGQSTRDTTVTSASGKVTEHTVATKLNGDGTGTRTVEALKPDGTTETRTETFTVTRRAAPNQ